MTAKKDSISHTTLQNHLEIQQFYESSLKSFVNLDLVCYFLCFGTYNMLPRARGCCEKICRVFFIVSSKLHHLLCSIWSAISTECDRGF
jgi:hypothetical protein